ncbi:hypothetical protein [Bradyrhizobium sp. DOA1]|uniref:hypothetical protein n=1 Tax=Bradyrhizobium sp. DOA1 TaxID=1126616 RepID=UPI00077C8306|nr:hypothetical protein [Bradyrhizobium sp. DOA1]KYH01707.1 hypothetical protein SE91_27360 [Bradyrhizobium sp. DOA1]
MKLEIPGVAMAFDEVAVGGFFRFDRKKPEFGICVTDGTKRAAIILSTPERPNGHMPWLAIGGLPNDAVVSFPNAILRANHADISDDTATYGHLLSAAGSIYMRVRDSMGGYRTFNLATGQLEQLPTAQMMMAYSKWTAGIIVDERFEPLFSFPAAEHA